MPSAVVSNVKGEKRVRLLEMELRRRQNAIDDLTERNAILEQRLVSRKQSEAMSRQPTSPTLPISPTLPTSLVRGPQQIQQTGPSQTYPNRPDVAPAPAGAAQALAPAQASPIQQTLAPTQTLPPHLTKTSVADSAKAEEGAQTSEQRLYSKVLESYRVHKDVELQKAVQILLKTYPESVYADNALYLAGLLAFESNNLAYSSVFMDRVLREYPNGNKTVAALFAKAMIAKRSRNFAEAKALLLSIRKLYPGSPEAMRAGTEEKLIELSSDASKNREG